MAQQSIVISHSSAQNKEAVQRINTLWAQIQTKQRRNAKFQAEMDELVAFVRNDLTQLACDELVPAYQALAERLHSFMTRKTLREWERQYLVSWLLEIGTICERYDQNIGETIHQRTRSILSDTKGEELASFVFDDDEMPWSPHGDAAAESDAWQQSDSSEYWHTEQHSEEADTDTASQMEGEISSALNHEKGQQRWLQKLYRKTANVLHPDKQGDKAAHDAMNRLNAARKNGDTATLVTLYVENVLGNNEWTPEHDEIEHLEQQLEAQLSKLGWVRDDIIEQDPQYTLAYHLLYDRTKKARAAKKTQVLQALREEAQEAAALSRNMTSLSKMRDVIDNQHAAHHGGPSISQEDMAIGMQFMMDKMKEFDDPEAFFDYMEEHFGGK